DHARLALGEITHDREVRVEERVHEGDQDVLIDERLSQLDRARGPVLDGLLDEVRPEVRVRLRDVRLDRFLQVARDENDLLDAQRLEIVQDVAHDRLVADLHQRLRRHVRMRPEPRPLPREGDHDLHIDLLRMRRWRMARRMGRWRGGHGNPTSPARSLREDRPRPAATQFPGARRPLPVGTGPQPRGAWLDGSARTKCTGTCRPPRRANSNAPRSASPSPAYPPA